MPVNFWEIHSHTVLLHQDGKGEEHAQRKLTLTNAAASIEAEILFPGGGLGLGALTLLGPPSKLEERLQTNWPVTRFAETLGLLECGKPVFLGYSWAPPDDEPDATYGWLLQIAVTTADRPWWE
jgi:hypothetical protein